MNKRRCTTGHGHVENLNIIAGLGCAGTANNTSLADGAAGDPYEG
jgi:hypothetical protein